MHDLSIVTDTLRTMVTNALAGSVIWGGPPPFSVTVTGQHPETPTGNSDCELSLYLFHIGQDKFLANSFWTQGAQNGGGTGQQPIAFEPLSLDLWYMLSAQASTSYQHEQQVLSVAMQALHEHGTFPIPTPTPLPDALTPSQATLVLESPTFDEISRLWQALEVPLRTTAQYRVSVIFLTPDRLPPPAPKVKTMTLVSGPATPSDDPTLPGLLTTRRIVEWVAPGPTPVTYIQSPATLAPCPTTTAGQEVTVDGLMLADTDQALLVSYPGGVETDVTAWKMPLNTPYPTPPPHGVPFTLRAPEGTPVPAGRYELTVARASMPGFRTRPVPLSIAAWVDPSGGPLLDPAGGVYTMDVRGVPADGAELRVGPVPLSRITDGAAPAASQWQHSADTITFVAPPGLATGRYQVGLRAADVESDPALWAVVP